MKTSGTQKKRRHSWYSEKGTTTAPCSFDPSMEWIVRCGQLICLVPKNKEGEEKS